jgi:hypothetical protein
LDFVAEDLIARGILKDDEGTPEEVSASKKEKN